MPRVEAVVSLCRTYAEVHCRAPDFFCLQPSQRGALLLGPFLDFLAHPQPRALLRLFINQVVVSAHLYDPSFL